MDEIGLAGWRGLGAGLSAWFEASSLSAGAALVRRVAELGGDGLPDVELRAGGVRVRVGSAEVAGAISAAAGELGLVADPAALQAVRVGIEVVDRAAVMPFWQQVLGYEPVGADGLGDPLRRDPVFGFRAVPQRRPLRNRIHVDVSRVADAVRAVKGAVGAEAFGAYGLTIADAEGNEIDLVPGGELPGGPATADWRTLFGAMTFYPLTSPARAAEFATVVAGLADEAGIPLLVDLRAAGVTVDSGKDQWEDGERADGGRFADLAGRIQQAARERGYVADPARLRFVQLGIDAVDVGAVRAFWTGVLGYRHDPRPHVTDIVDPRRLNPVLFVQDLDSAEQDRRRQRNRIHLDLLLPADQVDARLDTAVRAGGHLVATPVPGRHTVADPEGNEVTLHSCHP